MVPDGYKLVFEDDFDGNELNLDIWKHREPGKRRDGFFAPSSVSVKDSCMVIRHDFRDGEFGEGWYGGMVALKQHFIRGYFAARLKCNEVKPDGSWSAFWLMPDNPYNPEISKGGIGGAEIDILEAFNFKDGGISATGAIHCAGSKKFTRKPGELDSTGVYGFPFPECCTSFHEYALEWNEDEYIFFVDGKEVSRSAWCDGVCQVEEEIIFSLEPSWDLSNADKNDASEFFIDWIRVYQK